MEKGKNLESVEKRETIKREDRDLRRIKRHLLPPDQGCFFESPKHHLKLANLFDSKEILKALKKRHIFLAHFCGAQSSTEVRSFSENVAFGVSLDSNSSVTQGCRFEGVLLRRNCCPMLPQKPHFPKNFALPCMIVLRQTSQKCVFCEAFRVFRVE